MKKRFKGFTLSEVLITLAIVGTLVAMTLPPLISSTQETQYKTAYKKADSVLTQALINANADNALDAPAGSYAPEHWSNFVTIMSYIKTQKTCLNYDVNGYVADNSQCWKSGAEGWHMNSANGYPSTNDLAVVDISGMNWGLCSRGAYAYYAVDTNGFKPPNQVGKDRFVFRLLDATDSDHSGTPIKVVPLRDNSSDMCEGTNKCGAVGDKDYHTYFGTSWLYK